MTDILQRLRMPPRSCETITVFVALCREAADEIERLHCLIPDAAQAAGMREALEQIAAIENKDFGLDWEEIEEARHIARTALAAKPPAAPVETVLEECEDLQGRTVQTVRLADGTEVVRTLPRSSAGIADLRRLLDTPRDLDDRVIHSEISDDETVYLKTTGGDLRKFSAMLNQPQGVPQSYRDTVRRIGQAREKRMRELRKALEEVAAIGCKITDPNNTYGIQMSNIADAALSLSRPKLCGGDDA